MKGKTSYGISGGYNISVINDGKGSKGILPLSSEDNGFNE
jgi:hypothetical protein